MSNQNAAALLWIHHRQRLAGSDTTALRNRIAIATRNIARKEAHGYQDRCALPFEDLEQIALIGLLKAIERFDPSQCVAFTSFAIPYVRGEILHHLRDHGSSVKVPRRLRESYARVKKVERNWFIIHGGIPTEKYIADQIQISVEKLQMIRCAIANQFAAPLIDEIATDLEAPRHTPDTGGQTRLDRLWREILGEVETLPPTDQRTLIHGLIQPKSNRSRAPLTRVINHVAKGSISTANQKPHPPFGITRVSQFQYTPAPKSASTQPSGHS